MDEGEYCILWNNYHEALVNTLCALQREGDMADVTVVCGDGSRVRAHQLILAACSSFFRDFLRENPSKHPIVLLPMEIRYPELKAMVEFMYTGQVCVSQDRLQSFMRGARYLRIRGVEETTDDCYLEELQSSSEIQVDERREVSRKDGDGVVANSKTTAGTSTATTESQPAEEQGYSQWAECLQCHSRNMLPYLESPSMKYLCAVCSAPGNSYTKINDHNTRKRGKRKIQMSNKTEPKEDRNAKEGSKKKRIKLETPDETIELVKGQERTADEPQHFYVTAEDEATCSVGAAVNQPQCSSVAKTKPSEGAGEHSRDFYGSITIKKDLQHGPPATVFRVLGLFGVTGRKKRYSVTEAELFRRQGSPEHFSNNAMKTYLRYPRTQDALPEKFRTPAQRKTTISTFTNIIEGEAADLAQDFQRFLFASNLTEFLCKGVDDMSNISVVLDHMLDNLAHVDWTIKFNLLTHGAGLLFVRAVLLYVRSLAQ